MAYKPCTMWGVCANLDTYSIVKYWAMPCHAPSVRVPQDRYPCLMFTATEKKSVSNCTKKGDVLKSTHNLWSVT